MGCFADSIAADDAVVARESPQGDVVAPAEMRRVYEEVKTPFKYGVILRPGEHESIDCPNVFRFGDKWYMVYIAIKDKVGYETYLAESKDLLHWKTLGKILPFAESGWDQWQAAGGVALADTDMGRNGRVAKLRRKILDVVHRRREAGIRNRSTVDGHGVDQNA